MIHAHSYNKIFGWTFDGLQIKVLRYHCEALHSAGRVEDTTVALLKILDTFGEEIYASKVTAGWVMGKYSHANQVDVNNVYFQILRNNVSRCSKRSGTQRSALGSTTRQLHGTPLHYLLALQTQ